MHAIIEPTATALHCHLDGSLRPETMLDLGVTGVLEEFQRSNPSVRAAYTMRISGDGAKLVVSPPSDLNRDGVIEGTIHRYLVVARKA